MIRFLFALLSIVLVSGCSGNGPDGLRVASEAASAASLAPVVQIVAVRRDGLSFQASVGNACVLSPRLLLTAYHVVGVTEPRIWIDGRWCNARLTDRSRPEDDIAFLELDQDLPGSYPSVRLDLEAPINPGRRLYIHGAHTGLETREHWTPDWPFVKGPPTTLAVWVIDLENPPTTRPRNLFVTTRFGAPDDLRTLSGSPALTFDQDGNILVVGVLSGGYAKTDVLGIAR